jgi:catechol 2,3-dioxygenase-like lactoylglutathione lyase family enzyme
VLGRFLEYSIATPDIRASLDFYLKLGFSEAEVGETWPHPYAVVTDGRIHLGLHRVAESEPTLTFVKPDLLRHLAAVEALGVQFEVRRLGNDVFNELGWLDPSGQRIRMIEARTYSPTKRVATATSLCGYFSEIALPSASLQDAKQYWETLGFVGMDEFEAPLAHVSCTSDSTSAPTCRFPPWCSRRATFATPCSASPRRECRPRGRFRGGCARCQPPC